MRICVFCGANAGARPVFAEATKELGALIARRGMGVVYGGGNVGLMGILAGAALEAGGEVIGVIPKRLVDRELAHTGVSALHIVPTMHERKALMADLSDAFIALPGGFGTLDEIFEILTWAQMGIHSKPCGVLNVDGFFDSLMAFLDRAVEEGLLQLRNRNLFAIASDPGELIRMLDIRASHRTEEVKDVR
ncbi:MAG: TIGR00730 family Rossman fold protein [Betaproteobacteria bacterium]|nr:TIGR00730 family Rossman fold protein [Betaproteobacteria bacterium]